MGADFVVTAQPIIGDIGDFPDLPEPRSSPVQSARERRMRGASSALAALIILISQLRVTVRQRTDFRRFSAYSLNDGVGSGIGLDPRRLKLANSLPEVNRNKFHLGISIMKTRFASSIRLPLIAGAMALAVTGCGSMNDSMHRSSDRAIEPAGYVGPTSSSGIPPSIDPFSASYASFPASANESAGISGHSFFCVQHYNQPGCQSLDSARNGTSMNNRSAHYNRGNRSDTTPTYAKENSTGEIRSPSRY